MPSQSRFDGESTPDHWTWTVSPDLRRVWGEKEMEVAAEAREEKVAAETRRRRRRKRRTGGGGGRIVEFSGGVNLDWIWWWWMKWQGKGAIYFDIFILDV